MDMETVIGGIIFFAIIGGAIYLIKSRSKGGSGGGGGTGGSGGPGGGDSGRRYKQK